MLKSTCTSNLPVGGLIPWEKCGEVTLQFSINGFKCRDGWIARVKEWHSLAFKTVTGEVVAVDSDIFLNWQQMWLQWLPQKYVPTDIYNADETGQLFKCLLDQVLCCKGERCTGGKPSKERVTVMVCLNVDLSSNSFYSARRSARSASKKSEHFQRCARGTVLPRWHKPYLKTSFASSMMNLRTQRESFAWCMDLWRDWKESSSSSYPPTQQLPFRPCTKEW